MAATEAAVEVEIKTAIARQIETVTNEARNMQKWFDLEPVRTGNAQRSPPGGPTYESLGLRPLINCKGTYTIISGSLMLPEVREAMAKASQQYVQMEELQFAAGARISELMQSEWALVTCGCSAALLQLTAACMSGTDPELMCLLPDTSHPAIKNEVLVQRDQRDDYDAAVRMAGAKIIEYSSLRELEAKIGPKTAFLLALGDADSGGLGIGATHEEITPAQLVKVGHAHGIPVIVDAAAERPDVPNPYLAQGVDAVCYSGGKCMRGPQTAGMTLGKKSLLQAAYLNGAPHHTLGRPVKAGKEEIMGLVAAVEQWVLVRDHAAEWAEWERRLDVIESAVMAAVADLPAGTVSSRRTVQSEVNSMHIHTLSKETALRGASGEGALAGHGRGPPNKSNVAPLLTVEWEGGANLPRVVPTPPEMVAACTEGTPRIEIVPLAPGVEGGPGGIRICPSMMQPGDEEKVAKRLAAILAPPAAKL